MLPIKDVWNVDLTVEEAFKLIMSAGIVTPDVLRQAKFESSEDLGVRKKRYRLIVNMLSHNLNTQGCPALFLVNEQCLTGGVVLFAFWGCTALFFRLGTWGNRRHKTVDGAVWNQIALTEGVCGSAFMTSGNIDDDPYPEALISNTIDRMAFPNTECIRLIP